MHLQNQNIGNKLISWEIQARQHVHEQDSD